MSDKQEPAKTGTTPDVLDYYSRNWSEIANCYEFDDDGLPPDPAWYRRRLYNDFLDRAKPERTLDVGCGGGWTVLDALSKGIDARGIEPVENLMKHGKQLLTDHGHDADRIQQDDLGNLGTFEAESQDAVALLSVLPHVPVEHWDEAHANIARLLRPGGTFVSSYRNQLFDLYTFNSYTMQFYHEELHQGEACEPLRNQETMDKVAGLVTNPNLPGPYFTASADQAFSTLPRVQNNPLIFGDYLAKFGLELKKVRFYHYHCVPPLLQDQVPDYARICHNMEMTMSDDWRGNFMAAIFMIEAVKL